jgi:hypothetical protein
LQQGTRRACTFATDATRDQPDPAVIATQDFQQQRSFAPWSRMQDVARLPLDTHQSL